MNTNPYMLNFYNVIASVFQTGMKVISDSLVR